MFGIPLMSWHSQTTAPKTSTEKTKSLLPMPGTVISPGLIKQHFHGGQGVNFNISSVSVVEETWINGKPVYKQPLNKVVNTKE
jgi:N-acetylglucosamine-6-phosphate deacetylase